MTLHGLFLHTVTADRWGVYRRVKVYYKPHQSTSIQEHPPDIYNDFYNVLWHVDILHQKTLCVYQSSHKAFHTTVSSYQVIWLDRSRPMSADIEHWTVNGRQKKTKVRKEATAQTCRCAHMTISQPRQIREANTVRTAWPLTLWAAVICRLINKQIMICCHLLP